MPPRAYSSPIRDAAAAGKRAQVVEAAARLLRDGARVTGFSMEATAKAAGVTRLTVYKQFGSRRGLLEAVFDDVAERGGLTRIAEAMTLEDPRAGLDRLVEIFCGFWAGDRAIMRLNDAMALDPDFEVAVAERNERRRGVVAVLAERIAPDADPQARRDAVDLIFGLTGLAMFRTLKEGRTDAEVCGIVKAASAAALLQLGT